MIWHRFGDGKLDRPKFTRFWNYFKEQRKTFKLWFETGKDLAFEYYRIVNSISEAEGCTFSDLTTFLDAWAELWDSKIKEHMA